MLWLVVFIIQFLYLRGMPEGKHEFSYMTAGLHVHSRPWRAASRKQRRWPLQYDSSHFTGLIGSVQLPYITVWLVAERQRLSSTVYRLHVSHSVANDNWTCACS